MKKLTVVLLIVLTVFSVIPSSYFADNLSSMPFVDVETGTWYYKAVKYTYENKIFAGISDDTFGVDVLVSRAMIVTMLGSMEGIDVSAYNESHFSDVETDKWYTPYIEWAYQNKIVAGYGGVFGYDDFVTREQMTLILYKYSTFKGKNTNVEISKELSYFTDGDKVSSWAEEAMLWAVNVGLISGYDDQSLNPLGTTRRCEAAVIFYNYHYLVKKGELPPDTSAADALTVKAGDTYRVICWGDSLTYGWRSPVSYPQVIEDILNIPVLNYGVNSETSELIAMRQGGIPVYIGPVTIPAGTQAVRVELFDGAGTPAEIGYFGVSGINPLIIGGVEGTLYYHQREGELYFRRSEPGEEVEIIKVKTQIITHAMADRRDKDIQVIYIGSNNRYTANQVYRLLDVQKRMIEYSGVSKYIIVGFTAKSYLPGIDALNEALEEEYGEKYLDIREYFLTDALSDAGIVPTKQDLYDIAHGNVPSSLLIDDVHGNQQFYTLLAKQIVKKINELGYLED